MVVMEELSPMCDEGDCRCDWRVGLGSCITSSGDHTDGCDWRVGLGSWITSSRDHTDDCDGRVGPNV
jgi:hypothetical protein